MKVLVIFELIPEELMMTIADMTDEEYQYFSRAHGKIVNANANDEESEIINIISAAMTNDESWIDSYYDPKMEEYFGKWGNNSDIIDISDAEKLIRVGFAL